MSLLSQFAQYSTYDDAYAAPSDADPAVAAAVFAGFMFFMFIFILLAYVIHAFLLGRIFQKAGVEQWKAWVPVYNNWVLLELGGQQGFWAVLMFIPFINIVSAIFVIIAMYEVGLKLGKSGAFVLLAIFLPTVWMIWLAFDSSKWSGKKAVAPAGTVKATAKKETTEE